MEKYNLAITDYTEAIRLNSNNSISKVEHAEPYQSRGLAYFKQNLIDKAITDWTEATKINHSNDINYYNLAVLYSTKTDVIKAVNNLKIAIELNPIHADYKDEPIEYEEIDSYIRILGLLTRNRMTEEIKKTTPQGRIKISPRY